MNTFAWIPIACMPLRSAPDEKSEMATQLLFGDVVHVLEKWKNWARVHCFFDDYVGWIDNKTLHFIYDFDEASYFDQPVASKPINIATDDKGHTWLIPAGSTLPDYNPETASFRFDNLTFTLKEKIECYEPTKENVVELAQQFLHSPYLWGGKTALGIDCSGLTQVVYKIVGKNILRDASQQVFQGKTVSFVDEALPGDLMFFDNDEGKIVPVGIYMGNKSIIHASGLVRIDSVDNYGIFRKEINSYSNKLRVIKRLL